MDAALALETRTLALELHRLLQDLDPARFQQEASEALAARVAELEQMLADLLARIEDDERMTAVRVRVQELQEIASAWTMPEPASAKRRWMEFKERMGPAYEGLANALHVEDLHVPRLRPTNYKRNLMHGTSWLVALTTIGLSQGAWPMLAVAGSVAVAGWTAELGRKRWPSWNRALMWVLGPVAHPHETYRVNSATWYATALTILALPGSVLVAVAAVTVLGLGDPVAALIGRRWGRIRTMNGRSLEGSLAFFVAAELACIPLLMAMAGLSLGQAALVGALASLAGAVAETLCRRVDDNLAVPLAAGAAAALGAALLGIPL